MHAKKLCLHLFFCFLFVGLLKESLFISPVLAQASVDLRDYVARPDFVPHGLSTGEYVSFTEEGGSGGVRQYKNTNYEQFFIKSDGIYRREDTSWAPVPDFQDALCENGHKAIYALHPELDFSGSEVTSEGTFWAPINASVGQIWPLGSHTIVPIDSGVNSGEYSYNLPPLRTCRLSNLSGYPASIPEGQNLIKFRDFYEAGDYTFCTGAKNLTDLVVLEVISGPGTGDTFFFMKDWGLVGFETPGWQAGLASGPGVVFDPSDATCEISPISPIDTEKLPRTIIGRVISSKVITDPQTGTTKTQLPVENARICVYQGDKTGKDGIGLTIVNFETSGVTNEKGYFAIDSWLRFKNPPTASTGKSYKGNNYIGILCGNEIHEVFQVNMRSLQKTPLSMGYWDNIGEIIAAKVPTDPNYSNPSYPEDYLWLSNYEILTPIEVTLKCDPHPPDPGFGGSETDPPWKQPATQFETGAVDSACPKELIYTDRSGETMGDCGSGALMVGDNLTRDFSHSGKFELQQFADETKKGVLVRLLEWLFKDQAGRDEPPRRYEGLVDTRGFYKNTVEENANLLTWIYGGLGAALQNGVLWAMKGTPNPELVSCELWKQANSPVNTDETSQFPNLNAQSANGFSILLRSPIDKENPQSMENVYLEIDPTTPVCLSDSEEIITLGQIKPPSIWESYYEDLAMDAREEYCSGVPPEAVETCLADDTLLSYTTCEVDEPGCRFILDSEYFPYSLVAKISALDSGNKFDIYSTSQNNSYPSPGDESVRRTTFFLPDDKDSYQIEPVEGGSPQLRTVNEPADHTGNWDASGMSLIRATVPEMLSQEPPGDPDDDEEKVGGSNIMVMGPALGLDSGELTMKKSAHKSIKGFDYCITSVLDGHRMYPITRAGLVHNPERIQDGQTATAFNIDYCRPTVDGDGNATSDCEPRDDSLDFYDESEVNRILAEGGVLAKLFNIFSHFPDPDEGCTEGESCEVGSPDCACDCSGCDDDGCESMVDPDEKQECWEGCCVNCHKEKYSCSGVVDKAETGLKAKTTSQNLTKAFDATNRVAAMILPPNYLESGEVGTRTNLCTVDMYINTTDQYASENSEGIENPCSEYTNLMEAARQAVTPPGVNELEEEEEL